MAFANDDDSKSKNHSKDVVFTRIDARLNQVFGHGPKGSLINFMAILIVSSLLRLIYINNLRESAAKNN